MLTNTTKTSANFTGAYGHSYAFTAWPRITSEIRRRPRRSSDHHGACARDDEHGLHREPETPDRRGHHRLHRALNAGEARATATYRLATAGKGGSFTAKNATVLKLKSATYNSTTDSVTLTLKKPLKLTKTVQLLVEGTGSSGLEDSFGRLIDGADNGQPGSNAISLLSKGGGATIQAIRERASVAVKAAPSPRAGRRRRVARTRSCGRGDAGKESRLESLT